MLMKRRKFIVAIVPATAIPLRSPSAQLFLLKMNWNTIFSGISVALSAIPYVSKWLSSDTPEAKAALCKLSYADIGALQYRCVAIALALDANSYGPVIPPARGDRGIIPIMEKFVTIRNFESVSMLQNACSRMLDACDGLLSEVNMDKWLPSIKMSGIKPEDIAILATSAGEVRPWLAEFNYEARQKGIEPQAIDVAHDLLAQLENMPSAADNAIISAREIEKVRNTISCNGK